MEVLQTSALPLGYATARLSILANFGNFTNPPSTSLPDTAFQIGVKFGLNHLELEKCAKF
jgi:hypothetical protein